ncbi:serine protease inhibitor 88Ea-like [Sabethes cyaneus]|uniref:serine protease inhibitor 88Ea-like n=1 Tax=Sabethes cyaneus TaxID=53552 RepID=UPI00237E8160|nr:serine protease inhibitor 88Ea-like [Sabethes cyaneus]XP_053697822.1 serine protease inhibitor 88Ea-like [Sabethes cyaneus]
MKPIPCAALVLLLLATDTVPTASGQCLAENDNVQHTKADSSQSRNRLYKGESIFTLKLLEAINTATPTENVFFSPYSLYHVLLLMYFGAKTTTEKLLRTGLELHWTNDKPVVWQAYNIGKKSLATRFSNDKDIQFTSVDKLFFGKNIPVEECMEDKFFDEIEKLDYENEPEAQRVYINNWVENVTHGEIKDLLIPGSITRNTKLAVANAAYFKGTWQTKFKPEETKKEIFYISNERQEFVDMMHVQGTFNHAANEKLACHILELPYHGQEESSRVSMYVFLPPAEPNALEKLLARLTASPDILSEVIGEGISRQVDVKMPKFSIEKTVEMKPVLERMGMGNLFDTSADYSGFSKQAKIEFDEVIQKSKITVNEEGSTAASSTIAFSFRSSRPADPAMFHCNHPFVFIIYDYSTQAVLFNGVHRQPE